MAENEIFTDETGTSRRSLLAKAAAAGAVVYAAPIVSSIPAYAAGGLPSFNSSSGTLCVWFSPNQNSGNGKWHADVDPLSGDSGSTQSFTVSTTVGASSRSVRFSGNPNNIPGNLGANLVTDTYTYYGGGCRIESLDGGCWVEIQHLVCRPQDGWDDPADNPGNKTKVCQPSNEKAAPADWQTGSSITSIDQAGAPNGDIGGGTFQDAYYHTGRTGAGQGERCRLGILFRIRCV